MKKVLILSALLLSILSCSKENIAFNETEKQPLVFTAVIVNPNETKTSIVQAGGKVSWVLDDEITITDASSNKAIYSVTAIDDDGKATFTYKSGSTSLSGSYSAKYGNVNNQWYKGDNGAGCPMTSDNISAPSTEFHFTNDCGVFSISATANNIIKIEVSNGTSSYALNFSEKIASMSSGTDYYMLAVPNGFSFNKITFVKNDNSKYTKDLSINYSVEVGHLKPLKFTSADFNTDSNYTGYEYIALPGIFTINANGDKVRFGKGNLQHNATRYIFAENQYSVSQLSQSPKDLFTWSESTKKTDEPFSLGWRTLTRAQLLYITDTASRGNNRYICATVNGRNGLILFPDNYTIPTGISFSTVTMNNRNKYELKDSYAFPEIALSDWKKLEDTGCVFLPCAGYFDTNTTPNYCTNNNTNESNTFGNYWLNDASGDQGYSFWMNSHSSNKTTNPKCYYLHLTDGSHNKNYQFSVRLVIAAQ